MSSGSACQMNGFVSVVLCSAITYRYERALAEKLYHPDVYSKINLSVLREMNSAHALVLYENCYRFEGIGHTAWWDVDVFRKLTGSGVRERGQNSRCVQGWPARCWSPKC